MADSKIGKIYEGTSNMQLATIAKLVMAASSAENFSQIPVTPVTSRVTFMCRELQLRRGNPIPAS